MTPVSNWQSAWKWFSVQALALLAVIPAVWAALPPEVQAIVPEPWRIGIMILIAVAGVVGRLVDQEKTE